MHMKCYDYNILDIVVFLKQMYTFTYPRFYNGNGGEIFF